VRRSPLQGDEFVARTAGCDVGERPGPELGTGAFGLVHGREALGLGGGLGADADDDDLRELGALGAVHGHDDGPAGLDAVAVDRADGDGLGGGALLEPPVEHCGGGVERLGDRRGDVDDRLGAAAR
jgi:hypothetical protein